MVLRLLSRPRAGAFRAMLYRNVSRPLVRRMEATLEVPVDGGLRMFVDTRDILGSSLATRRTWEPHVTRLFAELLDEGDVFVDVGAHFGYYTLIASRIVGGNGRVYALEPHPSTHALLKANLELNEVRNVRPLAVAAGSQHGVGTLGTSKPSDGARMSLLADHGQAATPVPISPLAEILDQADVPRVRLVKIDVEGFEDRVLRGLAQLLEQGARPAILLEVHAHLNPNVREPIADFCSVHGMTPQLIRKDEGFDRSFALPDAVTAAVTPEWICSTALDHFELLLVP